jgi:glyceraldehyde-3-phosphate dehydrogenase (NADP+)
LSPGGLEAVWNELGEGQAMLARGGDRDGALVAPSVIVEPGRDTRVWREELFGPAVAVSTFASDDEALALANDTAYGLSMGVLTNDINRAMRFVRGLRSGMVHVNCPTGTTWRTDFVPYGGYGDSGFGKEGVKYAIQEMTEHKLAVIHPG